MSGVDIQEHARKLYEAHGDKAEHEAAQKASQARDAGDSTLAEEWQKVREAIHELRGPHSS